MERDTFDYIRDIVTMVGYAATVGSFVYLFRRDNDKQKQIDSLAKLALLSEGALLLRALPDLYKNGALTRPVERDIHIDLLNRGEQARLLEFNTVSDDITLHSKSLPYVLEKGAERKIFAHANNNKSPNDCEYVIEVIFEDKLQNKYRIEISGKGSHVSFGRAELIFNRYSV